MPISNLPTKSNKLQERTLSFEGIDPVAVLGVNDQKFKLIRSHFPKLKLVARGNNIKAIGEPEVIDTFERKLAELVAHIEHFNTLTEDNITDILLRDAPTPNLNMGDVLVHGNDGLQVKARTANQQLMVNELDKNDMLFAVGPAGTGKTYTAVALAVKALKDRSVKRVILTRPAVEAGENLGFLPGDLQDKLDPYLQPLYDALRDMVPPAKLRDFLEKKVIEIAPLAFMRGRTLDNAFVILDEAQNATLPQMKMFLTRMGRSAKFIITGDLTQVDLPKHQPSGLTTAIDLVADIKGIAVVRLTEKDVIRHKLVTRIINAFKKIETEVKPSNKKK